MDINPKSKWYKKKFCKSFGGFYPQKNNKNREICNLDSWDNTRRDMLILLLRTILENNIKGDLVEVGVYKGLTAKLIHYYIPERKFHLFDTFEGFTNRGVASEKKNTSCTYSDSHYSDTSLAKVKEFISPKNENISYYKGYFPESVPEHLNKKRYSFIHLDADLYEPTLDGLKYFFPRLSEGGLIVIHDYNAWMGARKAVNDFFVNKRETPLPMPDKSGSVVITKL